MLPLPWAHRWSVLGFTVLSQALIVGIQTYTFSFWIVPWADEFGASRGQLMMIVTASVIGTGLMSPWAGVALDKIHPRLLYLAGLVVSSLGMILVSMANSHWVILTAYALLLPVGLVFCGQLACQTLIARWFDEKRGTALGISALGVSLGALLFPPVCTDLLETFGWRVSFQLMAMASLILLAPMAWMILDHRPGYGNGQFQLKNIRNDSSWTTGKLYRDRDFLIISGSFAAILFAYLPVILSLGAYAHDIGVAPQQAALIASLSAIMLALGKIIFGRLTDSFSLPRLYQVATSIMIFGIVILSCFNATSGLAIGLALSSFGQGAYLPLQSSMIVSRFGALAFGQVLGLTSIIVQCSAISPTLAGLIRDASNSYRAAFLTMLIPLIVAVFAMQWLTSTTNEKRVASGS